ncbi:MAG TPA: hypothetical protein VJZ27_20270 [Aggregatilineales bacterium]|nr:hypothetical protein [Aggregatilineales bacterium]
MTGKTQQQINNLNEALGKNTWMRGMWLGFALIILFIVGAGIVFLLTFITGWELAARALVSLLLGPLVGCVLFYIYWRMKKPVLSTIKTDKE